MSDAKPIISCPGCQTRVSVPSAGKVFRCPKCGKQIQVRKPAATTAAPLPKPAANQGIPTFPQPAMRAAPANPLQGSPPQPAAKPVTRAKPPQKKLAMVAAGIGSAGLTLTFLGLVWFFAFRDPSSDPNVAEAPAQAPAPDAAVAAVPVPVGPEGMPEMPEKKDRPPGAAAYVGLDQIIHKPGETLGPAEEGSGKRVIGVGKSMQPNEVRTVMWRITGMAGGGNRQALGDQKLQTMDGYVPGSLVIDQQKQVVMLKYKGTVLTARDYRMILELETEITLDPEPHFP